MLEKSECIQAVYDPEAPVYLQRPGSSGEPTTRRCTDETMGPTGNILAQSHTECVEAGLQSCSAWTRASGGGFLHTTPSLLGRFINSLSSLNIFIHFGTNLRVFTACFPQR